MEQTGSQFQTVRRSTTSTVLRALTLVAGLAEPDTPLASPEMEVVAKDFARRGLDLNDLLATIRVGYAVLAAALLDAALELVPPTHSSGEIRRVSVLLFEVLDHFTAVATTTFLEERNAFVAGVSAARLEFVKKVIDGDPVDLSRANDVLGYSVDGHHLSLVASSRPHSNHDVRSVIEPTLRHWGAVSAVLIIPIGLQTIWAWGSVNPTHGAPPPGPLPVFDGTNVALGQPGSGLDGFRRSHLEARAVERLINLRRHNTTGLTVAHHEVGLEALLLAHPAAAQDFVTRILGPLGDDDPRSADLRATLGRYLDMDHSLNRVAAVEHISKNTVTYRVNRAFSLCGHSPGSSTTDLRAALRADRWLRGVPR
ncbi:PucR family transcriptional regulator [Gordonia terrae]